MGVSATHLDWTMVPYVRKSFTKHYIDGLKYLYNEDVDDEMKTMWRGASIADTFLYEKEKAYQYAIDQTEREIHQAVEGMYHNLNTLQSRSGNQLPFTSINYGTCTLPEGRMITKALLEVSIEGLGKIHKTSIFPCGIFQCMKGVNRKPGDPNYDLFQLALQSTARRLYPNYANCDVAMQQDWIKYDRDSKQSIIDSLTQEEKDKLIKQLKKNPELQNILMIDERLNIKQEQAPYEIMSTMGCRTQNGADINAKACYEENIKSVIQIGKLENDFLSAAQKDGRGNICPVTIILPTLAMKAKEEWENNWDKYDYYYHYRDESSRFKSDEEAITYIFMLMLDQKIDEAKDMLLERFNYICAQPAESAKFMYENSLMAGYDGKTTRSALCHGTLALGQLGLAECLQILIGKDHTTPEGMELAKKIEQLFKDRCTEFKKEYSLNFGVYYSPKQYWEAQE